VDFDRDGGDLQTGMQFVRGLCTSNCVTRDFRRFREHLVVRELMRVVFPEYHS
jgi:hypothetical protein